MGEIRKFNRKRVHNLYVIPRQDEQVGEIVIKCPKCGVLTIDGKCPQCGIPLVSATGVVKNGKVVRLEDFEKRTATIYPFPVRPILVGQMWICVCSEENEGDECWKCGKERPIW